MCCVLPFAGLLEQEQAAVQPREPSTTPAQISLSAQVAPTGVASAGFAVPESKPRLGGFMIRIKQSGAEGRSTVPPPQTSGIEGLLAKQQDPGEIGMFHLIRCFK